MRFDVFARTEVGVTRERNEDSFAVVQLGTGQSGLWPQVRTGPVAPPGTLLAVCDGMGGAAAGDVAAQIALAELRDVALASPAISQASEAEDMLFRAVRAANRAIFDHGKQHPHKRGMGTTLTAALLYGADVSLIQVGDSRAYLKRGDVLQQLTVDQNVVGQMVARGQLSPEDARGAKQRNMLLEAVGVQESVGPDLIAVRVEPGDVLLLCSDGLTGPLEDAQILATMVRYADPVPCCRALTEAACAAGGPDNVTVMLARFHGEPTDPPPTGGPIRFSRRPGLP